MAKSAFKGLMVHRIPYEPWLKLLIRRLHWGLYKVFLRRLPGFIQGVLTMAHIGVSKIGGPFLGSLFRAADSWKLHIGPLPVYAMGPNIDLTRTPTKRTLNL